MRTLHRQRETSETDHFKASTGKPRPNFTRAEVEVLLQNVDMSILFHNGYIHAIEFSGYVFIHCHLQCSYFNKSRKCGIFVMAFYLTLNTIQCQNGTGFMPCYKLSRTDCATVTHLYKLRPNTEQRHAMRTVRNMVKEHRGALVQHIEERMRPPHSIMGRLCRHVTIFYCSLPESVHQHKADITIKNGGGGGNAVIFSLFH